MQRINYDRLKKRIDDESEHYIIEKDVYSVNTGELESTKENYVDPQVLSERAQTLKNEVQKVDILKADIDKGNFDKIEDKRKQSQEK